MYVGGDAPEWAKNLLDKWVHINDFHFGLEHNVFVFYVDQCSDKVRIFAEPEDSARTTLAGKREAGMFATYIEESGCKIIETPEGLEQWTIDFLKDK